MLTADLHSAKRYERMMKSHGIASNAASIKPAPSRNSMKSERRESGNSSTKKRKIDAYLDEANTVDDDESGYASNIKVDGSSEVEQFVVKEEEQQLGQLSLSEAAKLMQYYDSPATYGVGADGYHNTEEKHKAGEFDAGSPAYAASSSTNSAYGMHSPQPYDFSLPYESISLTSVPTSGSQGISYQPVVQYPKIDQGRFDSPVVLE